MLASTLLSHPCSRLWPVANGPELGSGIAEAFSHPPQHIREDFGTARFDDNLGNKDLLFAVYTVDDSSANTPSQNPLSLVDESLREQVSSMQEQHVFSPSLLNTARFGYSRASYFFTGYTPGDLSGWVIRRAHRRDRHQRQHRLKRRIGTSRRPAPTSAATTLRRAICSRWTITSTGRMAAIRSKPASGFNASSPTICSRRINMARLRSARSSHFCKAQ